MSARDVGALAAASAKRARKATARAAALEAQRATGLFSDAITNILSALSAMPLPSRLALARALVPEMAVVERTAAEKWAAAITKMRDEQDAAGDGPIWSGYYMRVLMTENDLLAAIRTAAEEDKA